MRIHFVLCNIRMKHFKKALNRRCRSAGLETFVFGMQDGRNCDVGRGKHYNLLLKSTVHSIPRYGLHSRFRSKGLIIAYLQYISVCMYMHKYI